LANWTLDGLEPLLKRSFPSRKEKGHQIYSKVHPVRYADDFIITGRSQSQLVNEVLPLVEKFLRERGLELSAEKTHVTHIQKGFDFLGQNIRKYGRKLLVTPAEKNVQATLTKIRGIIEKNKSATQENLIVQQQRRGELGPPGGRIDLIHARSSHGIFAAWLLPQRDSTCA
jgi:RNA-directed DNA polymerase